MKLYRITILILGLTLSLSCLTAQAAQTRYQEQRAKTVVFRELIKSAESSNTPFFLAVKRDKSRQTNQSAGRTKISTIMEGAVNPSPQVMRWVGYSKFVKGVSQLEAFCQQMKKHHKDTEFLPGVVFTIYGLKWIAKNRVDVIASYRFNPCGSADRGAYGQSLFHLKLNEKNQWVVTSKYQIVAAG